MYPPRQMATTYIEVPGVHSHRFTITLDEYRSLVAAPDSTLEVMTSEAHDHKHKLLVRYVNETEK